MAQNISATNAFTTNYNVGVPSQSDPANIVQAFTEYHYGPGYTGVGLAGGMEGHLKDLADDITAAGGLVTSHSAASSGIHGVTGFVVGTDGSQTLTQKTLTSPTINTATINSPLLVSTTEKFNIVAGAAGSTINFDLQTSSNWYYTSNASANFVLNIRYASGTTLNTFLAVGNSATITFLNTNGATPYYMTSMTIDGSAQTIKWQYGTAFAAGNASAIDAYTFTILKTAATPTYTVIGSAVKFS